VVGWNGFFKREDIRLDVDANVKNLRIGILYRGITVIGIILAAGVGKRLRPLTKNIPKTLISIEGKTILEYIISNCYESGIKDFMVVVGHMKEEVEEACERIEKEYGVKIELLENERYSTTNTGFSLKIALDRVDDDVVVINGDNVFDHRILTHLLHTGNNSIVVDNVKNLNEESFKIALDLDKKMINRMGKEIEIDTSNGEFIGISAIKQKDLRIFREILSGLVLKNEMEYYDIAFIDFSSRTNINFVFTNGLKWTEIDDYNDLVQAERLVRELWK
jgi:L-glutamine-phosphate cytidylyltransferase